MPQSSNDMPISVILPYYNEEDWIAATIGCFVEQDDQRFRLLLVDNRSTDGSTDVARKAATPLGDRAIFISEQQPGKIHALAAGLAATTTPLVATCDADTLYPAHYIGEILRLSAAHPDASSIMAIDLYEPVESAASQARIAKILRKAARAPYKCHAGGYAQTFRTDWLRQAGGFDAAAWPYVLEDHEVVSRTCRFGRSIYSKALYCFPSTRRADRSAMDWTRAERLGYKLVPASMTHAYFHRVLGPRFARRKAVAAAQRVKNWDGAVS